MQNAKDSFYMALRARLISVNPERTILLRGAVRPGILVEEAEAPAAQLPTDVFVLRWVGLAQDLDLGTTMVAEQCEIVYETCGTQSFGGLDRGRVLSEMDEELAAMLQPFHTRKLNYSATPAAAMLTQVFWDEPGFAPIVIQRDRLSRTASVTVYSYQEQGGVHGNELVFSSGTGYPACARIFWSGESIRASTRALRSFCSGQV